MSQLVSPQTGLRILSLDGGDTRCLSQIEILRQYMHRLHTDSQQELRPCQHFHLITAVGASGLIAVLLGVLGLTIDETANIFTRVCTEVFSDNEITPNIRTKKLRDSLTRVLLDNRIATDARMKDNLGPRDTCKVSIGYTAKANMGGWRSFKNYEARRGTSYNPTIIEAILATWAAPGIFDSVSVGPPLMQEELTSAMVAFNNPTNEAIKEAQDAYSPKHRVSCIFSIGSGKKGVVSEFTLEDFTTQQTEDVSNDVETRFGGLKLYFRFSVERGLEEVILPTPEGFGVIHSHVQIYLSQHVNSKLMDESLEASKFVSGRTIRDLVGEIDTGGSSANNSIPPLSPFFILREAPMLRMTDALLVPDQNGQKVVVLSGMGGSGKTQLVIKFTRDHLERFQHIFFIDASSMESIRTDLVTRVMAVDPQFKGRTIDEALNALVNPNAYVTTQWLLILDNADSTNVDVLQALPPCTHGHVIVTTRRAIIEGIPPQKHIKLDVMSPGEAVEALLSSALGPDDPLPDRGREVALEIVEQLGYLPVAVIQAGCYINKQKCLYDYLNRFRANRQRILNQYTRQQDHPDRQYGLYAAFDTTLGAISPQSVQLISILSFLHFANFPRQVFTVAASNGFQYQRYDLMDRDSDFQEAITTLQNTLCHRGSWDEEAIDEMLEELQLYSLVSLISTPTAVMLRFHPLLHGWAQDRLPPEQRPTYKAAAVRLLVCAAHEDAFRYHEHLSAHIETLMPKFNDLHVNDQGSIAEMIRADVRKREWAFNIWTAIHREVLSTHSEMHVRTSRSLLQLAHTYGLRGDPTKEEELLRKALQIRRATCGPEHLETTHAALHLVWQLQGRNVHVRESKTLASDVLRIREMHLGSQDMGVAEASVTLGFSYFLQGNVQKAEMYLNRGIQVATEVLGPNHLKTLAYKARLAHCFVTWRDPRAEQLHREIIKGREVNFGAKHMNSIYAMASLAAWHFSNKRFDLAEKEWRKILEDTRKIRGDVHADTLHAIGCLALSLYQLRRYGEAEVLWQEEVRGRSATAGPNHPTTLRAESYLATCRRMSGSDPSPVSRLLGKFFK